MGYENAFFGFTDETTEGKWKWVTGETADYTNWSQGEPNGGSAEDYAMFYYKYPSGKWNDGDFGGRTQKNHKAVICEWGTYSVHTHSYQYSVTPATISKEGYISQKCSCGDEKNKTTIYCPSKAIFLKWGKVKTCTGYQVQYSTNKKFTNAYNYSVSSRKKTSATIKYLRGKTKYYVRVRSYKTVGSEKYYSAWSKTKSVRTKR